MRKRYQYGNVERRSRANGPDVWVYRCREKGSGKRFSKVIGTVRDFPTESKALEAAEYLRLKANQDKTQSDARTLGLAIDKYIAEEIPSRYSTKKGYLAYLNGRIRKRWGNERIEDLKPMAVRAWLRKLPGEDGNVLAPKTQQHILSLMRKLFDFMMLWEWIPMVVNPLSLIKIEGGSKRRHQPKVLTPPEISQLLVELQVEPWRTMVFGCLCFGLRLSEICALKWSDFDFDNLLVYIQRANVDGRVDETKTEKSHAAVPLDPDVADIFLSWKLKTKFSEPTDWVFASPFMAGEKPYFPRGVQQHHVRPAAERAGIGRIGTHTFRRTYRTLLGDTDAPLTVQQELMRHADIRTTMNTYGQALEGSKRTANSKVVQMVLSKGIA